MRIVQLTLKGTTAYKAAKQFASDWYVPRKTVMVARGRNGPDTSFLRVWGRDSAPATRLMPFRGEATLVRQQPDSFVPQLEVVVNATSSSLPPSQFSIR